MNVFGYDQPGTPEGKHARRNYILQNGMMSSALEHSVPEQMFRTAGAVEGISAVKALGIASRAGQRVYHITQANMQEVLPQIRLSSPVINEIRTAALTGKEIVTHTDEAAVPGWSDAGYIIFDPPTGNGAYKISGGANSGFLDFLDIFSTVFGISFDYKEMLAKYGGANKIADVFGTVAAFMALLGFLVGVVDIALTCSSDNVFNMIMLYTLMTVVVIGLIILPRPLGAFAAFAVGLVLGLLSNYLTGRLKESSMCV